MDVDYSISVYARLLKGYISFVVGMFVLWLQFDFVMAGSLCGDQCILYFK